MLKFHLYKETGNVHFTGKIIKALSGDIFNSILI
ncbi:rCG22356 [Rattus norvegicus]|uniref:RCG22356 n=1 Tax=Rattus norvegicus TaxID=10116 RepID=A6INX9_RAT|nr:rCG22356 [Rattus norvegicus]